MEMWAQLRAVLCSQLMDALQSPRVAPFIPVPIGGSVHSGPICWTPFSPNCGVRLLRSHPTVGSVPSVPNRWAPFGPNRWAPFIPVPIGGSVPSGPTRRRSSVSATWGSEAASPRQEKSWRNSVRHNLSLNECFVKAGRSDNGKGHFWAIHPANLEDFAKGDYHRRRARRRIRR